MYTNELLEEMWTIREQIAREADYDMAKHLAQLREFTKQNPPARPILRTQEEIARYTQHGELPQAAAREDAPRYGDDVES